MATSDLTAQRLRELLRYNPETGIFTRPRPTRYTQAGGDAGRLNNIGYMVVSIDRKKMLAHRLAWLYQTGGWPTAEVDHINGIRTDNRWENLRDVSPSTNQQNRRAPNRNNSAGLLGVSREKKSWVAQIFHDGKRKRLGTFDTPEEAHAAYVAAKRVAHPGCTL